MNAAIGCFTELGFELTSMDQIARQAGVSKRTVYNHFDSKDTLFDAIVHQLKDRCQAVSRFDYQPDRPLDQQLAEFGRRVVDFHCQRESRRFAAVILPRLLQQPELGKSLFGETRFFEQELTAGIHQAVAAGQLQCGNPSFAARQFLGLLESFVVWPQIVRKQPSPSAKNRGLLVQETVQMFLRYYG